jgi:hypothetical protein
LPGGKGGSHQPNASSTRMMGGRCDLPILRAAINAAGIALIRCH